MATIEKEFEESVMMHKANIVMKSLREFQADLYDSGGDFRKQVIAEKSAEHFINIYMDENEFDKVYEACWKKYYSEDV